MEYESLITALAVHCTVIGIVLFAGGVLLHNKRQFHLLSTGFWVWIAAVIFFFLCPLISLITGELAFYLSRLSGTEGAARVYWVMIAVAAGLTAFHLSYWITPELNGRLRLDVPLNRRTVPLLLAFVGVALYSIVRYRSDLSFTVGVKVEAGKFVGDVNGWEWGMHRFALFPMMFLLISRKTRWIGVVCLAAFLGVRMLDMNDRFTMVSPILACILLYLDHTRRKLPPAWMFGMLLLLTLFLVHRGHRTVRDVKTDYTLSGFMESAETAFSGADTDMLPQFYRESAVFDRYGYTYGVPLFEAAAFGWLPRNHFPWKDKLFDDLIFKPTARPLIKLLYGPKSSVIGNFYTMGTIPAVLIGMCLAGFLCRKLDGLILPTQPMAVRALGFTYLSFIWMVLGSQADWTLQYLVVTALPLVAVAVLERFVISRKRPVPAVAPRPIAASRIEVAPRRRKWREVAVRSAPAGIPVLAGEVR